MNVDDYTQPLEAVIAQERAFTFPVPLKAASYRALFEEWRRVNPSIMHEIELTALAIHRRGLRVSAKYLVERTRYESAYSIVPVPYVDQYGNRHVYTINNTITPLIARWLLELHPELRIYTNKSMFDDRKEDEQC